jgi:hypothetical protein
VSGSLPLVPGASVTLSLIADVDGSAGTVAVNEIDAFVTTALGVTITGSTAAIGLDKQDGPSVKQACRDSRGALSSAGPPDAYQSVATSPKLTGVTTITRAKSTDSSGLGLITIYVAGPNGGVDGASVTAAQDAIEIWADPLGMAPTVVSATEDTIAVTATISGDDVPADFLATITLALQTYFASLPIAGTSGGTVDKYLLAAVIPNALKPLVLSGMTLTLPAANVAYLEGHVPKLGAVTVTEV